MGRVLRSGSRALTKSKKPGASVPHAFTPEDLASLALSLRQTFANHKVPAATRASLIEYVIFQFAVFIDERIGSELHESIFAALGEYASQLGEMPEPADLLLAEIEIIFLKGRKAELNVLRSSLARPRLLRLIVEIAIGVRDTDELKARVDTEHRFRQLMKKKAGVKAVRFRMAGAVRNRSWQEIELRRSQHGSFEQSVEGLLTCIRAVVSRSGKRAGT